MTKDIAPENEETARIKDRIEQFSRGKPDIQFDEEFVICPYCGSRYGDCCEWVKEFPHETHCDECGSLFEYFAEYTATYITRPLANGD